MAKSKPPLLLNYNDGPLLPQPDIYVIYWGKFTKFPDFEPGMNDFLQAYGDDNYTAIMAQYLVGYPDVTGQLITNGAVLPSFSPDANVWQDPSHPAYYVGDGLGGIRKIGKEVCKFADAAAGGPDPDGIYLVYASNFPPGANYCAWHSYWSCESAPDIDFAIAYLPNLNKVKGCYIGPKLTIPGVTNPYSYGVRSNANSTAHELAETITDPFSTGWFDIKDNEIADKCLQKFASPVSLNDSFTWQLQELWSNDAQGCVQNEP